MIGHDNRKESVCSRFYKKEHGNIGVIIDENIRKFTRKTGTD